MMTADTKGEIVDFEPGATRIHILLPGRSSNGRLTSLARGRAR